MPPRPSSGTTGDGHPGAIARHRQIDGWEAQGDAAAVAAAGGAAAAAQGHLPQLYEDDSGLGRPTAFGKGENFMVRRSSSKHALKYGSPTVLSDAGLMLWGADTMR